MKTTHFCFYFSLAAGLFFNSSSTFAQTKISGTVKSGSGEPLSYANVILLGTTAGAMTDENGSFSFSTPKTEPGTVQISLLGYQKKSVAIKPVAGKPVVIKVTLEEADITLSELVVTGSSYSTESVSGLPVSPMEIVMTPGGAADVFQMLKTLPGLTPVSESADLYVRGGEPMESVVLTDQAAIDHPSTFESAYGGLFSSLPPSLVKNLWFSSGGFPAKYGNALSGILDIETRNEPSDYRFNSGWNFAGWDAQASIPIVKEKSGMTVFFKKSETGLLMKINRNTRPFTSYPAGWTTGGTYSHHYSETGRVKLNLLAGEDAQGVNVNRPEGQSQFDGNSENQNLGLSLSDVWNQKLVIKTGVAVNQFAKTWKLGVLDLDETDRTVQTRTDFEWMGANGQKWYFGGDVRFRKDGFSGRVPASDKDYRSGAAFKTINPSESITTAGGYLEWEQSGWMGIPALSTRAGFRTDNSSDRKNPTLDPRITIAGPLSGNWTASLNWGIFHQSAWLPVSDRQHLNKNLPAMSAIHTVYSMTYSGTESNTFRAEIWNKNYDHLPLKTGTTFSSDGYGFARGLDVIYKGLLPGGIDGWISYGWSVSKRKWLDSDGLSPSSADITHNLTWIGKKNLNPFWQLGWNLKLATGRPYTPVTGGLADTTLGLFTPVYGKTNSDRLPFYHRLDVRITYTNSFLDRFFLVGYAELLNILDTDNPMGYSWNSDYTKKIPVRSYFGNRTVVLGTSISF